MTYLEDHVEQIVYFAVVIGTVLLFGWVIMDALQERGKPPRRQDWWL